MNAIQPNALARTLRAFFTDHLPHLRGVSPHTIESYRYALILLLRVAAQKHNHASAKTSPFSTHAKCE